MAFKLIILFIVNVIFLVSSEDCVVHNDCHCLVPSEVICNTSLTDLSFNKVFQSIKEEKRFDKLMIENNDLVKLPNNAFGKVNIYLCRII